MKEEKGLFRRESRAAGEALEIGLLLALVGGFLDAYSYLLKGGVFANAQTGNLVLLGIHAAKGDWTGGAYYLAPIAAFFLGVVLTEVMRRKISQTAFFHWSHIALAVEAVLLFVIGLMPQSIPFAPINITISFICSVQVCAFKKLFDVPYATTMCTGNLRSGTEQLCAWLFEKNKKAGHRALCYFLVILAFCIGAGLGVLFIRPLAERSVWICSVLLLVVLGLMLADERKIRLREKKEETIHA